MLVCTPSSVDQFLHQILLQQQQTDRGKIEICNLPEFNIYRKDTLHSEGRKNVKIFLHANNLFLIQIIILMINRKMSRIANDCLHSRLKPRSVWKLVKELI